MESKPAWVELLRQMTFYAQGFLLVRSLAVERRKAVDSGDDEAEMPSERVQRMLHIVDGEVVC